MSMTRESFRFDYTMAVEANAKPISLEGFAGGSVEFAASASVTIYGSNDESPSSATFVPAYDEDGIALTMAPSNARIQNLPSAVYAYQSIKLVLASSTATCKICLKS